MKKQETSQHLQKYRALFFGMALPLCLLILFMGGVAVQKLTESIHIPVSKEIRVVEASGKMLGKTTYEGVTTATTTGSAGGIDGLNSKCQVDYPDSHICTQGEIVRSGVTSISSNGWIICDLIATGDCYGATGGFIFTNSTKAECDSFTSSSSNYYGAYMDTQGKLVQSACSTARKIHCCS